MAEAEARKSRLKISFWLLRASARNSSGRVKVTRKMRLQQQLLLLFEACYSGTWDSGGSCRSDSCNAARRTGVVIKLAAKNNSLDSSRECCFWTLFVVI